MALTNPPHDGNALVDQFGNSVSSPPKTIFGRKLYVEVGDRLGPAPNLDELMGLRRLIRKRGVTSSKDGFIGLLPGKYPYFVLGTFIFVCWGSAGAVMITEEPHLAGLVLLIAALGLSMMSQWWSKRTNKIFPINNRMSFLASTNELVVRPGSRMEQRVPMSSISHTASGIVIGSTREGERVESPYRVIGFLDQEENRDWLAFWGTHQPHVYVHTLRKDLEHRPVAGVNRLPPAFHWTAGLVTIALTLVTLLIGMVATTALFERWA